MEPIKCVPLSYTPEYCLVCDKVTPFTHTLKCMYCNSDNPFGEFYDNDIDDITLQKYLSDNTHTIGQVSPERSTVGRPPTPHK